MCGFPQSNEESKPLTEEEIAVQLALNNETVEISNVESLETSTGDPLVRDTYCNSHDYEPPDFQIESYEFRGDTLVITNGSQKRYYQRDYYGEYCRSFDQITKECVSEITSNSYKLFFFASGSTEDNDWKECFAAKYNFVKSNQTSVGESAMNDSSPNDSGGNDQPPEADPDPEPEYATPSECDAVGLTDFTLSPATTETSPSDETTCEYTLTVNNIGQDNIVVFKHIYQVYYTGEDDSKWEKYVRLSPGESYSWDCYNETRNYIGTFAFYYINAIAPIYDTDGCMNTFKNNSTVKEEIKRQIPIPCE